MREKVFPCQNENSTLSQDSHVLQWLRLHQTEVLSRQGCTAVLLSQSTGTQAQASELQKSLNMLLSWFVGFLVAGPTAFA